MVGKGENKEDGASRQVSRSHAGTSAAVVRQTHEANWIEIFILFFLGLISPAIPPHLADHPPQKKLHRFCQDFVSSHLQIITGSDSPTEAQSYSSFLSLTPSALEVCSIIPWKLDFLIHDLPRQRKGPEVAISGQEEESNMAAPCVYVHIISCAVI